MVVDIPLKLTLEPALEKTQVHNAIFSGGVTSYGGFVSLCEICFLVFEDSPNCSSIVMAGSSAQWDSPFKFSYKGRLCEGKAIHIAALHPRGAALLDQLLLHKADLNAEFTYDSRGGPVHTCTLHSVPCSQDMRRT